ncbi:MAG: hypothetical protein E7773_13755 [Sphingomonas sp.]|uniref:hypothetical protein n=1 Tax=Sphingomonas sp. TaxID=28214 RepID=UPI0011FBE375|nr:hypothetical protein [Sphingomonas sp.]THD34727.1 MAG: hypothetical protein E7773_13755 [Sphingomonas sp.]
MMSTKRSRVVRPLTAIEEEFRAQLGFLRSSCEAYDRGETDEFRRIALAIRVLVYDRGQSQSVISQLGLTNVPFISYCPSLNPANLLSEAPLVMVQIGADIAYRPLLDEGPFPPSVLALPAWWEQPVFRTAEGEVMERNGFVLFVANQAGGAHVDPELDEQFHRIANENAAGWIGTVNGESFPLEHLEKAYIRHIGFETLKSLEPEWERIAGNRICGCGTGRKFRYCCGKSK